MKKSLIFALLATLSLGAGSTFATMTEADLEDLEKANAYYAEENFKKAYKEYRGLARNGHTYSQERLAEMAVEGLGTKKSPEEAYAWSVLAAQDNDPDRVAYRDSLWASLSDTDRKGAQKTADKFMKKYSDEALAEKAQRAAERAQANSMGTCVGSRMKRNCQ